MNIDYDAAKFWFEALRWVAMLGMGVWVYLRTKDNDNVNAVNKVAVELAEFIKASGTANAQIHNRITVVEETIRGLPTHREQSDLRREVGEMVAKVSGMKDLLNRVEHQTALIHSHLLDQK